MRTKEWRLIVTFHTTAEAMACEAACKREQIAGRMIPVPRELSSGCGLAWCAGMNEQDALETLFFKERIVYQEFVQMQY